LGATQTWYHKKNSLAFFNSFKMKLSVIVGVIHVSGLSAALAAPRGTSRGACVHR
jgi:hypothetical protein